jgi:hypothetical protein
MIRSERSERIKTYCRGVSDLSDLLLAKNLDLVQ